jgi:hypothetical protein
MRISVLIAALQEVLQKEGDLPVWVDSPNEVTFGEIQSVEGKLYSGRASNNDPHCFIAVGIDGSPFDGTGI